MLVAQVAALLQCFVDDTLEFGGNLGVKPNRGDGAFVKDFVENSARTVPFERQRTGGHFVQHNCERKQICPGIQWFAENLFRRHVGHGAERAARARELARIDFHRR